MLKELADDDEENYPDIYEIDEFQLCPEFHLRLHTRQKLQYKRNYKNFTIK